MKWMLVVVVFGLAPVKTDLVYDNLAECLAAERAVSAMWATAVVAEATHQHDLTKMVTPGTCIPYAAGKN